MNMFFKIYDKVTTFYYNIKWTIINFYKYAKIVSKHRPWDYIYILEMIKFQLEELCNSIKKYSCEIEKDKLQKINDIKRVIEILDSQINDEKYLEKCGYMNEAIKINFDKNKIILKKQPGYEYYDINKIFSDAEKLKQKEWNELFEVLKEKLQEWWH